MKLAAIAALTACALAAQELRPEIRLLSQIKRHVKEELAHLPNYACLQTAVRYRKNAGFKGRLAPVDTTRMEVLFAGKKELFTIPGGGNFYDTGLSPLESSGLSGTGAFGSFLQSLFVDDVGIFTWRGPEDLEGRHAVRYDFRVSALFSGWTVIVGGHQGVAAMKGSVWADAESLDLLRLEINGDDIPAELNLASINVTLDYGRMRIGDRDIMLPQTGEMRMVQLAGEDSRNVLEFTHCRTFETESTLTFGDVVFGKRPPPPQPMSLPTGLTITLKLDTPITEKSIAGDTIEALVSGDVTAKGKIWIPDGSRVTGQIRRLYRNSGSAGFTLGLEFTEVRSGDSIFRFFAELIDPSSRKDVVPASSFKPADLPGVGTFLVNGTQLTLPAGFRMVWKTRNTAN